MLWMKGWLETRAKLVVSLLSVGFFLFSFKGFESRSAEGLRPENLLVFLRNEWLLVMLVSALVAGAGIATQPGLGTTKGVHGSQLFTLALPVSRLRLLAVRSMVGWLELSVVVAVFCIGLWSLFAVIRQEIAPTELLLHAISLIACATGLYAIPVLLATFLEDQWRVWGTALLIGALRWLSNETALPPSLNIFRAMGEASPLITHEIPWPAIAVSMGLALVLFFLALRIAQAREY